MRRLNRSRPRPSVPRKYSDAPPCPEGGCSRAMRDGAEGSCGASKGAKTAQMTGIASRVRPSRRFLLLKAERRPLVIADPRVKQAIRQVDDQLDGNENECDKYHSRLDKWKVTVANRLDHQSPDSRPGEHALNHDTATEQVAVLQADYGDCWNQCVLQHVFPDHTAGSQALGSGRANVILVHDIQHIRADQPRDVRHQAGCKRD